MSSEKLNALQDQLNELTDSLTDLQTVNSSLQADKLALQQEIERQRTEKTKTLQINQELIIDNKSCLIIEAAELETIVSNLEKAKAEKDLIEWGMYQLLGVLGLTNEERTKVKAEVLSGEESVFKSIMKSGADLMGTFMATNLPGSMGRNAEEKVKQKFGFVDQLLPLLKNNEESNG